VAKENFEKAAQLYTEILSRCGPEDDRAPIAFELCKCLFRTGRYQEAVSGLETFVAEAGATNTSSVKEALLVKGQAHLHMGDLDKAIDTFRALVKKHPEADEIAEAELFTGYCYMLQNKFKAAVETFEGLIETHPSSPYAIKARVCLICVKDMTQ
jgi:outer membrane protein assembly factor BamD (BamD/ComL family)